MKKIQILILFLLLFTGAKAFSLPNEYLVLGPGAHAPGVFSAVSTVIGLLDQYENDSYAGVHVNFENGGWYYEPSHGPNWWNYYFEPIALGNSNGATKVICPFEWHIHFALRTIHNLSTQRSHELIKKYVHVKPHIKKKVSNFVKKKFKRSYIIGVHYRGTDKMRQEAPQLSYEGMFQTIKKTIKSMKNKKIKKYKIFVATDEVAFLNFMKSKFPKKVLYTNSFRSSGPEPVHSSPGDKYVRGEEAVIDCLLLSKCNYLIRTSSNLSWCSTLFNPSLPVKLVNPGIFDKSK